MSHSCVSIFHFPSSPGFVCSFTLTISDTSGSRPLLLPVPFHCQGISTAKPPKVLSISFATLCSHRPLPTQACATHIFIFLSLVINTRYTHIVLRLSTGCKKWKNEESPMYFLSLCWKRQKKGTCRWDELTALNCNLCELIQDFIDPLYGVSIKHS